MNINCAHGLARRLIRVAVEQRAELVEAHALFVAQFGRARRRARRRFFAAAASSMPSRHSICCIRNAGSIAVLFSRVDVDAAQRATDRSRASADRAASDTPRWCASPIASRCAVARRRPPRSGRDALAPAPCDRRASSVVASSAKSRGRSNRSKWLSLSDAMDGVTKATGCSESRDHERKRRHAPPLWPLLRRHQTRNDSPQPHSSFTFGLLNLKPSFKPSRAKSSSVPSI